MTIFQHQYNPAEWDMVDDRPEGEYFSLSEESSEDERESHIQSLSLTSADSSSSTSSSDSDSDTPSLLNFLDIKMFGTTPDLPSLLRKREELTSKLSLLSPGQFFLIDYYNSQLQAVNDQISSLQQPSVVSIHNYTPTDDEFLPSSIRVPPQLSDTKKKAKTPILAIQSAEPTPESDSIDQTISSLEKEVKAKEELIRELWTSLKIQKRRTSISKATKRC
jgi:cytoskeletal protein RodZ